MITTNDREGTSMTTPPFEGLPDDPTPGQPLTARQRRILAMLAEGLINQEIARALHVGEGTVKTLIRRVFLKLGVTNRAAAVNAGWERGLLPQGGEPGRALEVMTELIGEHGDPIHWDAWRRILADRFEAKKDRERLTKLEQARVSPMPWLDASRTA